MKLLQHLVAAWEEADLVAVDAALVDLVFSAGYCSFIPSLWFWFVVSPMSLGQMLMMIFHVCILRYIVHVFFVVTSTPVALVDLS